MKRAEKPSDIPEGEHYAIISFHRVLEASSGYPDEPVLHSLYSQYEVYLQRSEWEGALLALAGLKSDTAGFVGLHVKGRAKLVTTIEVTL